MPTITKATIMKRRMEKRNKATARVNALVKFIVERHEIHRKKRRGEPKPWTDNPFMQKYRFCNVFRELDTVTEWIAENWREPHADDPDLWFAMVIARLVNWPETLAEIGYPVPWHPDHFLAIMADRKRRKEKDRKLNVYGPSYMIPAGPKGVPKPTHQVSSIFNPMWEARESLRRIVEGRLSQAHRQLMLYAGMGSFIAAQVIADLKYVEPMRSADDWSTWAAKGPGSERGLNRVLGRSVNASWCQSTWLYELQKLHAEIKPLLKKARLPRLHAQDLQNCLCEFDKIERVRLGEGKPKCKYPGV